MKPVLIFLVFGRSNSSKRTACNCLGEPTLNSLPASLCAPAVSRSTSPLKNAESSRNLSKSTPIPVFSMSANSTKTGISISSIRADISRSEISLLKIGTNFIIEIAPRPSNCENSDSSCSALTTPRNLSVKSSRAKLRPPGLIRYAANSVSKASPDSGKFRAISFAPCKYLGSLASCHHSPNFESRTMSNLASSRATEYSRIFPSGALNAIAIGSLRPTSSLESSSGFISFDSIFEATACAFVTTASLSLEPNALTRSLSALISNLSRSKFNSETSAPSHSKSEMGVSISMSLRSLVSSEFNSTLEIFARSESPTFPPTDPMFSINFSRLPYSAIHLAAVFSPTPGIDGKLSLGSPRRAAKSGYCSGVNPYFSMTASGVMRARSVTPRLGYNTVVFELISWKESRSPVQIKTSNPSSPARLASVAMMSSASKPSTAKCLIPKP